jgi:hypothetical protein
LSDKRWTFHEFRHPDNDTQIAFWQRRMENVDGSPLADGRRKNIIYIHPCSPDSQDTRLALDGKPDRELADRCLYGLSSLRLAIDESAPAVFWTEGEKDANEAEYLLADSDLALETATSWEGPAVSHHGGADKATSQQAEHFRGYRGRVFLAVDWDAAGAACALRRRRLLRQVGLEPRQLWLVRPADGALALPALPALSGGGAGGPVQLSGADRFALEELSAELGLAATPSGGADLVDHVRAGYGLGDLVRVRRADLRPAAEQHSSDQPAPAVRAEGYLAGYFTAAQRAEAAAQFAKFKRSQIAPRVSD